MGMERIGGFQTFVERRRIWLVSSFPFSFRGTFFLETDLMPCVD